MKANDLDIVLDGGEFQPATVVGINNLLRGAVGVAPSSGINVNKDSFIFDGVTEGDNSENASGCYAGKYQSCSKDSDCCESIGYFVCNALRCHFPHLFTFIMITFLF
jgi:hypothetical protein